MRDLESQSKNSFSATGLKALTILGIDHGEKRIGLALKPAGQTILLPLGIVEVESLAKARQIIRQIINERRVDIVVVGIPVNREPSQAQIIKKFTRSLREGVKGVRWRFVDETLTSQGASDRLREAGFKGTKQKPLDDHAAMLILDTFLQLAE